MAFDSDTTGEDGHVPDDTNPGEPRSREEVLALLDEAMAEAHRKVTNGRVRDAENERVRQGWVRTLAYCVGQYRQLRNDEDLVELNERLDELEARLGEGETRAEAFRYK